METPSQTLISNRIIIHLAHKLVFYNLKIRQVLIHFKLKKSQKNIQHASRGERFDATNYELRALATTSIVTSIHCSQRSRSSVKFNQLFVHRELNTALRRRVVHFFTRCFYLRRVIFYFFRVIRAGAVMKATLSGLTWLRDYSSCGDVIAASIYRRKAVLMGCAMALWRLLSDWWNS